MVIEDCEMLKVGMTGFLYSPAEHPKKRKTYNFTVVSVSRLFSKIEVSDGRVITVNTKDGLANSASVVIKYDD